MAWNVEDGKLWSATDKDVGGVANGRLRSAVDKDGGAGPDNYDRFSLGHRRGCCHCQPCPLR